MIRIGDIGDTPIITADLLWQDLWDTVASEVRFSDVGL